MDIKEKLVDIVCDATQIDGCNHSCNHSPCTMVSSIVDALIKNGVTLPQWISVDDRLPDENTTVIAATDNGIVLQCLYAYDGWDLWDGNEVNITHWQQMPQLPKGE